MLLGSTLAECSDQDEWARGRVYTASTTRTWICMWAAKNPNPELSDSVQTAQILPPILLYVSLLFPADPELHYLEKKGTELVTDLRNVDKGLVGFECLPRKEIEMAVAEARWRRNVKAARIRRTRQRWWWLWRSTPIAELERVKLATGTDEEQ